MVKISFRPLVSGLKLVLGLVSCLKLVLGLVSWLKLVFRSVLVLRVFKLILAKQDSHL